MKKNMLVFLLGILCFVGMVTTIDVEAASYTLKKGDILVSNRTSSNGLTGHAGLAVGNNKILHIAGGKETTKLLSLNDWKARYGKKNSKDTKNWTKVYRVKDTKIANKAADWAIKTYWNSQGKITSKQNKKPQYSLGGGIMLTTKTYCSKIIWQAYRIGIGNNKVIDRSPGSLALPYSLPDYFGKSYKPSKVATI